jgi:hypothetical protein
MKLRNWIKERDENHPQNNKDTPEEREARVSRILDKAIEKAKAKAAIREFYGVEKPTHFKDNEEALVLWEFAKQEQELSKRDYLFRTEGKVVDDYVPTKYSDGTQYIFTKDELRYEGVDFSQKVIPDGSYSSFIPNGDNGAIELGALGGGTIPFGSGGIELSYSIDSNESYYINIATFGGADATVHWDEWGAMGGLTVIRSLNSSEEFPAEALITGRSEEVSSGFELFNVGAFDFEFGLVRGHTIPSDNRIPLDYEGYEIIGNIGSKKLQNLANYSKRLTKTKNSLDNRLPNAVNTGYFSYSSEIAFDNALYSGTASDGVYNKVNNLFNGMDTVFKYSAGWKNIFYASVGSTAPMYFGANPYHIKTSDSFDFEKYVLSNVYVHDWKND